MGEALFMRKNLHGLITLNIQVYNGDTVTVTNGTKTYIKTATSNSLTFILPTLGTWTATCGAYTKIINVDKYGVYDIILSYVVLGIQRNITSANPQWTRTDDAANFKVKASVGTIAGYSDFNNVPIYSEIIRETLATGDVMVKIPCFYYQRSISSNIETIKISNRALSGFTRHPAFSHNGTTQNYIYVGAYETNADNFSKTGQAPKKGEKRNAARTAVKAKGTGWGLLDITTVSAINMLILIECASNHVQKVIGEGNQIASNGIFNTGKTDGVVGAFGVPAEREDSTSVIWRGIENWWGNVWTYVDGLNWNNGEYWICNNQNHYADDTSTNYTKLSYSGGATNYSNAAITRLGIDTNNSAIMLPSAASNGSYSTYYCQGVWSTTNWATASMGGAYSVINKLNGPLCFTFHDKLSDSSLTLAGYIYTRGNRLIKIP